MVRVGRGVTGRGEGVEEEGRGLKEEGRRVGEGRGGKGGMDYMRREGKGF